jgi:hypothetical protein
MTRTIPSWRSNRAEADKNKNLKTCLSPMLRFASNLRYGGFRRLLELKGAQKSWLLRSQSKYSKLGRVCAEGCFIFNHATEFIR